MLRQYEQHHGSCFDLTAGGVLQVGQWCAGPALQAQMQAAALVPPILLKSLTACGLGEAHSMAILLSLDSLSTCLPAFKGPVIAQQFVNHGGLVHKVSVLGKKVSMPKRESDLDYRLIVIIIAAACPDAT